MPLPSWLQPIGQNAPKSTDGPSGYSQRKCPSCGARLAYGYVGSSTDIRFNTLICENQTCRLRGQAQIQGQQKPIEAPKVVVVGQNEPASPKAEAPKIESDETVRADKLSFWDKLDLSKSRRPVPTKYFCPTCCKTRAFIVDLAGKTRCPQCKCQFGVSELETGA